MRQLTFMPLIKPTEIIDLKAPIRLHHWNKINNTIIALLKDDGHISIVKINGGNTAETEKQQLPQGYLLYSAQEIILSDDGNSILFFTDENVYAYSWTKRQVITLERPDFAYNINFDGGGFLNNSLVWVRLRDDNNIYLIQWDLTSEEWNWTNLAVHIRVKHYEEGGNFDCFRLEIHPSKKMFLGVADFDHGGFCSKLFYLVPPEDRRMKFIHPQGLSQETGTRHSHAFNLNGDKIACVKVLHTDDDEKYEVVVYSLNDFTKPLLSYRTPKQFDYINNIDFLANDDFMLIANDETFIVADLVRNKIIYKNKHQELWPQTGPDSCSFCTINNTRLLFYIIDKKRDEIKDPSDVANKFIREHEDEIHLTNPVKTKLYPELGLAPLLCVYHEFYQSKFDIRTGRMLKSKFDYRTERMIEDKLPDYVQEEVRIWLEQNRETQLLKWEEIIGGRTKYTLETEFGTLYFYSTLESERSDFQISIEMAFDSTGSNILLNKEYNLDDYFPPEISKAMEKWLKENFDEISKPWKELPHFQSMKKDFFEKKEKQVVTPKPHTEPIYSNPFDEVASNKRKPEGLSFWQKVLRFLNQ